MNPTHQPAVDVIVTPADILRGAARYLQLHGWHQGDLYADTPAAITPPACALGAIGMAAFGGRISTAEDGRDESDYRHATDALIDYLYLTGADVAGTGSLGDWNDEDGRTAAEVIAALNAAADEWDRQHTPPTGGLS
jgi:hypothetical protein